MLCSTNSLPSTCISLSTQPSHSLNLEGRAIKVKLGRVTGELTCLSFTCRWATSNLITTVTPWIVDEALWGQTVRHHIRRGLRIPYSIPFPQWGCIINILPTVLQLASAKTGKQIISNYPTNSLWLEYKLLAKVCLQYVYWMKEFWLYEIRMTYKCN